MGAIDVIKGCRSGAARMLAALICRAALAGAAALAAPAAEAQAAQVAARVVQLDGPMSARTAGADGHTRIRALALQSEIEAGDTLVTEAGTWARLVFIDNSEITLKPGTTVSIDQFSFDAGRPAADRAGYTLVKGALRAVTGLLGKRSKDRFALRTPSATIGIRGTTFVLEVIAEAGAGSASPGLDAGLHVYVRDGGLTLVNQAGTFYYDPGQWGYFKDDHSKPVKMTANPGMQFAPPASFGEDGQVW